MKVIIAGSRDIFDYSLVEEAMSRAKKELLEPITTIISGGARGVDTLGEIWARRNLGEPPLRFVPDWDNLEAPGAVIKEKNGYRYNAVAGFERNSKMVELADALVAIWDGHSKGTADTIDKARTKGIPVFVYLVKDLKETL